MADTRTAPYKTADTVPAETVSAETVPVELVTSPPESGALVRTTRWEGGEPARGGRFFALLSLLLLCVAVAVVLQLVATTVQGFIAIAPSIALALLAAVAGVVATGYALRFHRRTRDIAQAQPLITWREFVQDAANPFGQLIKEMLTLDEIATLRDDRDRFQRFLDQDLALKLIGNERRRLLELFEKEWWRFKLGLSRYQQETEALIRHGASVRAAGAAALFGKTETLPQAPEDYREDEALFLRLMDGYFFQIVRQSNRKRAVLRDLEDGCSDEKGKGGAAPASPAEASNIDDLLDAECYAYFEYGKGSFAMFMRVYFSEHPEVEENELNFRRVLRENLPSFQRRKTILDRVDARYGQAGAESDPPDASAPER